MSIDNQSVQNWLDAYSHAWLTYDPDEIGALFSEDAAYRWHPWDEGGNVSVGRDHIVAAWVQTPDRSGTYRGEYRPLLVQEDMAIAVGTSSYYTDETRETLERVFYNLWVLHFDAAGQCRSFTEWYMEQPHAEAE